jgi:hypothetical protein
MSRFRHGYCNSRCSANATRAGTQVDDAVAAEEKGSVEDAMLRQKRPGPAINYRAPDRGTAFVFVFSTVQRWSPDETVARVRARAITTGALAMATT